MEKRSGYLADINRRSSQNFKSSYESDCETEDSMLMPGYYEKMEQQAKSRSAQSQNSRTIIIASIGLLIILGIGSASIIIFLLRPTVTSLGWCGFTAEQARERGCVFDLMMSIWTHPSCYDQELSEQFLMESNFVYFWDVEGTKPFDEKEARNGSYDVIYTNGSFHLKHCSYIWARQTRARRKKPYVIDVAARSVEHIKHCNEYLGNPDVTLLVSQTGTKLTSGTKGSECIVGEKEFHSTG